MLFLFLTQTLFGNIIRQTNDFAQDNLFINREFLIKNGVFTVSSAMTIIWEVYAEFLKVIFYEKYDLFWLNFIFFFRQFSESVNHRLRDSFSDPGNTGDIVRGVAHQRF